ncbi:MAG: hypothetical protein R2861_04775 [Desulfobacterales bacterium]
MQKRLPAPYMLFWHLLYHQNLTISVYIHADGVSVQATPSSTRFIKFAMVLFKSIKGRYRPELPPNHERIIGSQRRLWKQHIEDWQTGELSQADVNPEASS